MAWPMYTLPVPRGNRPRHRRRMAERGYRPQAHAEELVAVKLKLDAAHALGASREKAAEAEALSLAQRAAELTLVLEVPLADATAQAHWACPYA